MSSLWSSFEVTSWCINLSIVVTAGWPCSETDNCNSLKKRNNSLRCCWCDLNDSLENVVIDSCSEEVCAPICSTIFSIAEVWCCEISCTCSVNLSTSEFIADDLACFNANSSVDIPNCSLPKYSCCSFTRISSPAVFACI